MAAWEEAEAIAKIVDNVLVTEEVERQLAALQAEDRISAAPRDSIDRTCGRPPGAHRGAPLNRVSV